MAGHKRENNSYFGNKTIFVDSLRVNILDSLIKFVLLLLNMWDLYFYILKNVIEYTKLIVSFNIIYFSLK